MRRLGFAVTILAVCALGCASNGSSGPRKDVTVRIDDMSLVPTVIRVAEGGNVGWMSVSEYAGIVSFPLSIESSFTCTDLRPVFTREGDRLVSTPITGEMENVVLPCPLAPGEYDYSVALSQAGAGPLEDLASFDPLRTLDGKIIVEGATSP